MPDLPPDSESPPVPPASSSPPPPPPPGSSASAPVGTVEVVVLVDGSPAPLCHIRVASGVYDEVGLFVDPTANPLVFTDVPETTSGLLQTYCYPTLYPGCAAVWSATWPGGSYPETEVPDDGSPFGPLTVIAGETTQVVIDITCNSEVPSGSSPPPPPGSPPAACCPPVPWCLEGGGWDTFPVGDRPAGVTGRPLRSAERAVQVCPPRVVPPLALEDCYPEAGYTVPGEMTLSVVNVENGTEAMANWPYSGASAVTPAAGGPFYYDAESDCYQFGCGAVASWPTPTYPMLFQVSSGSGDFLTGITIFMYLAPRPDGSGIDVTVGVGLAVNNAFATCGSGELVFVGDNGFSDFDSTESSDFFCLGFPYCRQFTTCFFPGTTLSFAAPVRVGRLTVAQAVSPYPYLYGLEFDIYIQ